MHGTPYTTEFILNTIYDYISLRITITNRTNIESLKRNIPNPIHPHFVQI